jgi:hypothetical protein
VKSVTIKDPSGEILIKIIDHNGRYELIRHPHVTSNIEVRDDKNCKVTWMGFGSKIPKPASPDESV